jgi:hypothetical protein
MWNVSTDIAYQEEQFADSPKAIGGGAPDGEQ